jgi:drug/metabolite transporter (DMT)-like permease
MAEAKQSAMPAFVLAALTLLAIVAFAGNSLLTRAALGGGLIGPGAFSAIRLAAGALILLPWALAAPRARPSILGAVSLLAYVVGFSFAYRTLGAAMGAMILFASVQATILALGAARGVRISLNELCGMGVALAGMVYLLGGRSGSAAPLAPVLMMAVAGVAWAVYTQFGRGAARPARSTAGNFLLAAIIASPLPLLDAAGETHMAGVVLACVAGAVTSGLGYIVWYAVAPRLRTGTVGAVQLATPVVAGVGGAVMLGEPLTVRLAIAGGVILAGIALTLWRPARAGSARRG